jgi:hypothetical protein
MTKLMALAAFVVFICGCSKQEAPPPADEGPEPLSRTEFTERLENFFEYEPLKAGKSSQFLIHLTDLSDGRPVEKATVTLSARRAGSAESAVEQTAQIGRVTGIYVAELSLPQAGSYDIEFHIKNPRLDERLALTGFTVE